MSSLFPDARAAARSLLTAAWNGEAELTAKAGQFCGGLSMSSDPLTEKQADWLATLLTRAGLPPVANGGRHD